MAQFYIKIDAMSYVYLILTIIFESFAIIAMKLSEGFHNRIWTVTAITTYILSFFFLALALKQLPTGIANAIWAGGSTLLVAAAGIIIFKENLNGWQVVFLLMIAVGIAGISLAGQHHQ